jgi:hypothetical protein
MRGSAVRCILWLTAILAVAYSFSMLSSGVRTQRHAARFRVYPGLVQIEDDSRSHVGLPSILPGQFQAWSQSRQRFFDRFAFYQVAQEPVSASESRWGVAYSSYNLFAMLNLPLRFAGYSGSIQSDAPRLILSDAVWKRDFGANPQVIGSLIRVGAGRAVIAGVAPEGSWRLPGMIDAWVLEPNGAFDAARPGFVLAHLTPMGEEEMWAPRVRISAYRPGDAEEAPSDDLLGISLDQGNPAPGAVFFFAVFLAFLALPATTSVSLDEYSFSSQKPSWSRRICRWSFLAVKMALLLPIVYFLSLDLTYSVTTIYSPSAIYIEWASTFLLCLFGLRWAIRDQRQRCPVCLRRVAHPAQVGHSSRTFLAWNGTELICMDGHTLLHVPGLPTSWFSTQRWLYLDTSWGFLFAGSGRQI